MESPFEVLGVEEDASDAELREAYRERVKEVHPDHGGSLEAFQRVQAAYTAIQSDEDDPLAALQDDTVEEVRTAPRPEVEYLNYEVLDDHGWDVADPELFRKAARVDLDPVDYGRFEVPPGRTILEAAEERGWAWPFACRGGACANCAVAVVEGEVDMPGDHVLGGEFLERGIRLSCLSTPLSEELKLVYNVKHLPELDELRLPPGPFEAARATD